MRLHVTRMYPECNFLKLHIIICYKRKNQHFLEYVTDVTGFPPSPSKFEIFLCHFYNNQATYCY